MRHLPLIVANTVLGLGLMAAALASHEYVSRLAGSIDSPAPPAWAPLLGLVGQERVTVDVVYRITAVEMGEALGKGPAAQARLDALAQMRDAVAFRIVARNLHPETLSTFPWHFSLSTSEHRDLPLLWSRGFSPPRLRRGERRELMVAFAVPPTMPVCELRLAGDALVGRRKYKAVFDLCE